MGYFLLVGSAKRVLPYFSTPSEGSASRLRWIRVARWRTLFIERPPGGGEVIRNQTSSACSGLQAGAAQCSRAGAPGLLSRRHGSAGEVDKRYQSSAVGRVGKRAGFRLRVQRLE